MRNKDKQGKQSSQDPAVKYVDPNNKDLNPKQQSRRDFLEGSGAAVVAGAGISALIQSWTASNAFKHLDCSGLKV